MAAVLSAGMTACSSGGGGTSGDASASDGTDGSSADAEAGTSGMDGTDGTSATDGTAATDGTDATDATDATGATDGTDGTIDPNAVTYRTHIEPLLADRCVRCHSEGGIREDNPLDTYERAKPMAMLIKDRVTSRTMPPWLASQDCREYAHDESLSEEQIAWVAEWADAGAPEGSNAMKPVEVPPVSLATLSREDLELTMPGAYVPGITPDDYRCFVLDWPEDKTRYITGYGAKPGNVKVVHHIISYLAGPDMAETVEQWDAADEGPGYTCYGGPTPSSSEGGGFGGATQLGFIGGWAPGGVGNDFPANSGIKVEPGSKIIMQVHYNTLTNEPEADQTAFVVKLDDTVEHEGFVMPWTNFQWLSGNGMKIPAGEVEVTHAYASDPHKLIPYIKPLATDKRLELYSANLHMHTLGVGGSVYVERASGESECLLEINNYDFGWQRTYGFMAPVQLEPGDQLGLSCTWDNSPANQVVVDGSPLEPVDQHWGEGTTDEMCIAFFYVIPRD